MTLEGKDRAAQYGRASRVVRPGGACDLQRSGFEPGDWKTDKLWGWDETSAVPAFAVEESACFPSLGFSTSSMAPHDLPRSNSGSVSVLGHLWRRTARGRRAKRRGGRCVALLLRPMLDVARTISVWGRIIEDPGEDTWVASQHAEAPDSGLFPDEELARGDSLRPKPSSSAHTAL